MSPTENKPASKKSAVKKTATRKTTAKKTAAKKAAVKKATVKKATVKKVAVKKTGIKKKASKKAAPVKTLPDHNEVNEISAKTLETMASDIDRQMKMLAEIDTRMLIAKDQLADLQETIQAKIKAFQERKANKPDASHKDLMTSIRETRDEAAKIIKESRAIHDTYESAVKYFEKGRVAAMKEAKKAETMLVKKLHQVEAKVLKKAGEIKKNIKK